MGVRRRPKTRSRAIASELGYFREEAQISNSALAVILDLPRQTLSDWLTNGVSLDASCANKLLAQLDEYVGRIRGAYEPLRTSLTKAQNVISLKDAVEYALAEDDDTLVSSLESAIRAHATAIGNWR